MPIYDYKCDNCALQMEIISPIEQRNNKHKCSCGGKLSKVLHAPSIRFKGEGFYKSDKSN